MTRSVGSLVCVLALASGAGCTQGSIFPPPTPDTGAVSDVTPGGDSATDIVSVGDVMDAGTDVVAADAQDGAATPPDAAVDARTDAPVTVDGGGSCTLNRVMVTTTDFTTGGYVVGAVAARALSAVVPPADGGAVPQDHVVRTSGCVPFELYRSFANEPNYVVVANPDDPYHPRRTIPLPPVPAGGDGGTQASNPSDIAVISPTRAYVLQYNSPRVLIVDPTREGAAAIVGDIDLTPVADADGIPEAIAIAVAGPRAFVALQQLARPAYAVPAHSHVAVIDLASNTLVDLDPGVAGVQAIELTYGNPAAMAVSFTGELLLVAETGDGFAPGFDGGIDVIDLATGLVANHFAGSDPLVGGDPSSIEVVDGSAAWFTVSRSAGDAGTVSEIRELNYATMSVRATPVATSTTVTYGGLRRAPDGTIWAIDAGFGLNGSVMAFNRSGTPVLTPPFATPGVNTYSLDFVP